MKKLKQVILIYFTLLLGMFASFSPYMLKLGVQEFFEKVSLSLIFVTLILMMPTSILLQKYMEWERRQKEKQLGING